MQTLLSLLASVTPPHLTHTLVKRCLQRCTYLGVDFEKVWMQPSHLPPLESKVSVAMGTPSKWVSFIKDVKCGSDIFTALLKNWLLGEHQLPLKETYGG